MNTCKYNLLLEILSVIAIKLKSKVIVKETLSSLIFYNHAAYQRSSPVKWLQSPTLFFCVNSFKAPGRHVAHYHCVVCSVTIARKTDMISHLKRHVNKGETEASYSGNSDVPFEEPGNDHSHHLCSRLS